MIFRNMMTRWWQSFRDLARYGDSHPSELMIGFYHSLFVPFLVDDYKHLSQWMLIVIILMGLMQSYFAVVGSLTQRHSINLGVAFASVAFVVNSTWHCGFSSAHCLILTTAVSLWNVYRTNYEISRKVGAKWIK